MSQISQKSISGITSITTPAGIDDVFTVHSGDTTERFRVDQSGNQNISGIVTATNFKTGSSNLHSTGLTVGDTFVHSTGVNGSSADIDDFVSVGNNIHLGNAGVITATSFSGDGSNLTSLPAGLGTALSSTQTDPLNKLYYTNQVLGVGATITVDPPASASKAYTQYADIKVDSDADLIIAEGDDLIPDVLGLADFGNFGGGASAGRIRVNSITNAAANGATTIQNGVVISGMTTITGGLSIGGTITYEDVTNVDSIGIVTARGGIHIDDSIVHIGDTDTKIRFPAANTVTVEAGGHERIRIASSKILKGLTTARGNYGNNTSGVEYGVQIEGTSAITAGLTIIRNSNDANDGGIVLGKTRATSTGGNTVVQAGDDLGNLTFAGNDGSTMLFGAEIFAEVQSGVGNDDMPADLIFKTNGGSTSTTERLRINSNGSIQITPEGSTSNPYMLIDTSGDSVRFSAQKASGNNEFRFLTQSSGTVSERLRITSDGAVSWKSGTTPLSGTGNNYSLNIYRDSGGGYGYFDVVTSGSNHTGVRIRAYHNGTYNNVFEHNTNDYTSFSTGGSERLRITSGGLKMNGGSYIVECSEGGGAPNNNTKIMDQRRWMWYGASSSTHTVARVAKAASGQPGDGDSQLAAWIVTYTTRSMYGFNSDGGYSVIKMRTGRFDYNDNEVRFSTEQSTLGTGGGSQSPSIVFTDEGSGVVRISITNPSSTHSFGEINLMTYDCRITLPSG